MGALESINAYAELQGPMYDGLQTSAQTSVLKHA